MHEIIKRTAFHLLHGIQTKLHIANVFYAMAFFGHWYFCWYITWISSQRYVTNNSCLLFFARKAAFTIRMQYVWGVCLPNQIIP